MFDLFRCQRWALGFIEHVINEKRVIVISSPYSRAGTKTLIAVFMHNFIKRQSHNGESSVDIKIHIGAESTRCCFVYKDKIRAELLKMFSDNPELHVLNQHESYSTNEIIGIRNPLHKPFCLVRFEKLPLSDYYLGSSEGDNLRISYVNDESPEMRTAEDNYFLYYQVRTLLEEEKNTKVPLVIFLANSRSQALALKTLRSIDRRHRKTHGEHAFAYHEMGSIHWTPQLHTSILTNAEKKVTILLFLINKLQLLDSGVVLPYIPPEVMFLILECLYSRCRRLENPNQPPPP